MASPGTATILIKILKKMLRDKRQVKILTQTIDFWVENFEFWEREKHVFCYSPLSLSSLIPSPHRDSMSKTSQSLKTQKIFGAFDFVPHTGIGLFVLLIVLCQFRLTLWQHKTINTPNFVVFFPQKLSRKQNESSFGSFIFSS